MIICSNHTNLRFLQAVFYTALYKIIPTILNSYRHTNQTLPIFHGSHTENVVYFLFAKIIKKIETTLALDINVFMINIYCLILQINATCAASIKTLESIQCQRL